MEKKNPAFLAMMLAKGDDKWRNYVNDVDNEEKSHLVSLRSCYPSIILKSL